jgi:hypothetical protein
MRALIYLFLCALASAQIPAAPRMVMVRAESGAGVGFVRGIASATLYPGYWVPPEVIDPPSHGDPITDFDPLQSTFPWMYDSTTNRALLNTRLGELQVETGALANKSTATIDQTIYVNWTTGTNTGSGSTIGAPHKDLQYAVNYAAANYAGQAVEIRLLNGVQYIVANGNSGTGVPPGGDATVRINNYVGTAADPVIVRSHSGDPTKVHLRIAHAWLAANYDDIKAGTYELNTGIQFRGTTSYIELWDFTMVGPIFEIPYYDLGGDASGAATLSHSGTNIKLINMRMVQWPHCGIKGDIKTYGCLADNNGVGDGGIGGHDHGYYITDGATEAVVDGDIVLNSYANALNPRNYDVENLVIRDNILGYSGGYGAHVGGLAGIVENNLFLNNGAGGLLWGEDAAGLQARNNIFHEDNIDTQSKPGGDIYARAVGFTWTTNGALTGETPDSLPTIQAWSSGVSVNRPASVTNAGNAYFNRTTAGPVNTGATAPVHGSGDASDDNVTWTFVSASGIETTGTFTTIAAADFVDFAAFDFRPDPAGALIGAGTEFGQGDTLGPFQPPPSDFYFVDKDHGSAADSPTNGAENLPWLTIQYGISQISGGDTLVIKKAATTYDWGNSTVNVASVSGTVGDRTLIRGYGTGANRPIIANGRWGLNGASYINFRDLEMDGTPNLDHLMTFQGASNNITVKDCYFHHTYNQIIYIRGNSYEILFENNVLEDGGALLGNPNGTNGEAFYIGQQGAGDFTHHITIRNNVIDRMTADGIEFKHDTHHCIAEGNIISNCVLGNAFGTKSIEVMPTLDYGTNPEHIVRGNTIFNHPQYGAAIHVQTGCQVYNNVVYNVTSPAFAVQIRSGGYGTRFVWHNSLDVPAAQALSNLGGTTSIESNLGPNLTNNLAWNDAYVVDANNNDYHLVSPSAPIDAGNPVPFPLTTDFDGDLRSAPFDYGAFEF